MERYEKVDPEEIIERLRRIIYLLQKRIIPPNDEKECKDTLVDR